jgi:cell division protein FtsI (penicillin-binding protein 3)
VDDPRFLIYVWLEKPQINKAASVVAAPVFRQVVDEVIVQLNIAPDKIRERTQTGQ